MTYRERRMARAELLREWADKREQKSSAAYATSDRLANAIPFGQPILVGHHSERRHRRDIAQIDKNMRASIEHSEKAKDMRQRAENIERSAGNAIYSDDLDAIERLEEKIGKLEARRDAIRAYNASCRRGKPDLAVLPADLHDDATSQDRWAMAMRGKSGELPAYALTNLGGNINRLKKRLEHLKRTRA